jgi:hypothetical protein
MMGAMETRMCRRLTRKAYLWAGGGLMWGILQAVGLINFNQILFEFLSQFLSLLTRALLGGDPSLFGLGIGRQGRLA